MEQESYPMLPWDGNPGRRVSSVPNLFVIRHWSAIDGGSGVMSQATN